MKTFTVDKTHLEEPQLGEGPHRYSLLLYHRDGEQLVPLHDGRSLVIGRSRPADVAVRDRSLSRQHAQFTFEAGTLWVEDLGSTNGTFVNSARIKRSEVKPGDDVQLGSVSVAFHTLTPASDEPRGLESHDRFVTRLEQQLASGRTFDRPAAIIMVRAGGRTEGHVSRWAPRLRTLLRPADAIALYGPCELLLLLAETDSAAAMTLASEVAGGRRRNEPQLLCGVAVYPEHGISPDELIEQARRAALQATSRRPVKAAGESPPQPYEGEDNPVVHSPKMRQLYRTAQRVAGAEVPVLIVGDTGTGKEVLAREIHRSSPRRKKPLRCLNCGAIPPHLIESALFGHEKGAFTGADQRSKGLFEEAAGGIVLLDEVGELSPEAQTALLRVIETKRVNRVGTSVDFEVDVRVFAATHRDLEGMCEAGKFRWDLYYRLNTLTLAIPPLRERSEDILPLAESFMHAAAKTNRCVVRQIDSDARRLLQSYDWPGNVRELRNVIERAVVIAQDEHITVDDLSERVRGQRAVLPPAGEDASLGIKERMRRYEKQLIIEALAGHDWNQTQTAKALKMPLRTLVHKIRQLGIEKS